VERLSASSSAKFPLFLSRPPSFPRPLQLALPPVGGFLPFPLSPSPFFSLSPAPPSVRFAACSSGSFPSLFPCSGLQGLNGADCLESLKFVGFRRTGRERERLEERSPAGAAVATVAVRTSRVEASQYSSSASDVQSSCKSSPKVNRCRSCASCSLRLHDP